MFSCTQERHIKSLTKAQDELLRKLENGCEVTFINEHYVIVGPDDAGDRIKIWPSTFYGLYDGGLVELKDNGNYTVSEDGIRKIRGKKSGVVETPPVDQAKLLEEAQEK